MDSQLGPIHGGWLSGQEINFAVRRGEIVIDPYCECHLNPNSYNYRLGSQVFRLVSEEIDLMGQDEFEELTIPTEGLRLMPGECYLGSTVERFGSNQYASLVTGRSSIGRKFVTNHITAGLVDVGFLGQITLEITVQRPTRVYAGVSFGQIFWFSLAGLPAHHYTGKYQFQEGPTASRISQDRTCASDCCAAHKNARSQ